MWMIMTESIDRFCSAKFQGVWTISCDHGDYIKQKRIIKPTKNWALRCLQGRVAIEHIYKNLYILQGWSPRKDLPSNYKQRERERALLLRMRKTVQVHWSIEINLTGVVLSHKHRYLVWFSNRTGNIAANSRNVIKYEKFLEYFMKNIFLICSSLIQQTQCFFCKHGWKWFRILKLPWRYSLEVPANRKMVLTHLSSHKRI